MFAAASDEPRLGEGAQLQRYRAERDVGHSAVDVTRARLAIPDEPQDFAPARRGDRGEHAAVEHVMNLDQTKMKGKRGLQRMNRVAFVHGDRRAGTVDDA